jgi:DNA-binding LacI/PurR family transcriptional regulator
MKKSSQSKIHKHLRVYSALHQAITAGRWGVGEKLPSEAELVRQFGVSRITAGSLMHSLRRLGGRIPHDVRLVGIDDVEYASLLPVPLTTLRQPTRQIGETSLAIMLQRIARPDLPPRETRLACELIVRESCGARATLAA